MKILLLLLCVLPIFSKAQSFGKDFGQLDKKISDVIEAQNHIIGSGAGLTVSLFDAEPRNDGGLLLTYKIEIDTTSSLEVFFFNPSHLCYMYQTVQKLANLTDQLSNMEPYFNKINENTYYSKESDLKMVYHTYAKQNIVMFTYAKKTTKIP